MADQVMMHLEVSFDGESMRVKRIGLNNHDLRTLLVGFWACLDPDDRADHIEELTSYLYVADKDTATTKLPPAARLIRLVHDAHKPSPMPDQVREELKKVGVVK